MSVSIADLEARPHTLYRFYDAADQLLYIGITVGLINRWNKHAADKPWWQHVARASVEHFPSRSAVLAAEESAIRAERPKHNVQHNGVRRPPQTIRDVLARGGRTATTLSGPVWEYRTKYGTGKRGRLALYWEVEGDPISDSYTSDLDDEDGIDAEDLMRMWFRRYGNDGNDVPIYWFVDGEDQGTFEGQPWGDHFGRGFLAYYTWPVNVETGERLNWMSLPVVDKLWREDRCDKGGFIQEATGWKPSAFVPTVNASMLMGGLPSAGCELLTIEAQRHARLEEKWRVG